MQTLYELLGALPDDDADGLRAAFRKSAKANHPDNNPGDPDAPQRFRRIVRANAILGDRQQRAAYDSLLARAHPRHRILSAIHHLVPDVISSMVIACVSICAFLLFERVLTVPIVPAQIQNMSARASALTAAMPTQPSDTAGPTGELNKPDKTLISNEPETPDAVKETTAAVAAATDDAVHIRTTSETGVKDAKYYRKQGSQAYRSGDLALALIDFDLAIDLDPNFSDAYIDRAIVFRRMGDMKRAFADVAQAKRIDDLK